MLRLLLLCCCSFSLFAQATLQDVVDRFAGTQVLSNSLRAVDVRDVETGRQLAEYQSGVATIPASTQKLLTTAVAMDVLGADYRFVTRLVASGKVTDGTLNGDLYIVGGGDPTLGSSAMEGVAGLEAVVDRWVAAVRERGIRRITGAVVGDGGQFGTDGAGRSWPWADMGNYYGAGAYGLNLHENSYTLTFTQRQQEGSTPPISGTDPYVPGLSFTNELRSGPRGSGDQAYIFGAPFSYDYFVRGSIPVGTGRFSIRGSIPDPALFAAQRLTAALREAGVEVVQAPATHRTVGSLPAGGGEQLDEQRSPPLAAMVDRTNLTSNNLYAEALLRALNRAAGERETGSTEVITNWLERRGIDTKAVRLEDGSGLSPRNYFPSAVMTAFLVNRAGERRWRESIPLAGRTGSLRNVLKGTAAEGRVWGKSGTVSGVRAYAGYVDRADGRRLAYHIAVNNHTVSGRELNRLIYGLMGELATAGL